MNSLVRLKDMFTVSSFRRGLFLMPIVCLFFTKITSLILIHKMRMNLDNVLIPLSKLKFQMKKKTKKLMIFAFDSWCMDPADNSTQQHHAWLMESAKEIFPSLFNPRRGSSKISTQITRDVVMGNFTNKSLQIKMWYPTISFSSKDIELTLMLKFVHQYLLSSTFSSTFTKDLIVQISISRLKMDKKRLLIMIKLRPFRMLDM